MGRVERIRQNIVSKIISNDNWWEGNILQSDDAPHKPLEHHFFTGQPAGKRRRIIEKLIDLTARDFKE
jgi:hypothetical protein